MNQNNDDENYGYQEKDYGQDYYDEGQQEDFAAEEGYAEEGYDDSQLPVQEGRTFFQRFANLIIFGGIGIFVLIMGYINFGHLLFGPDESAQPQVTADQLLNPGQATAIQETVPPPPADAPIIPPADGSVAIATDGTGAPEMNAMGVSPAAPVTGTPDGGMALSPAAPPANPEDPWAEVAAAPPSPPAAAEPVPVTPTAPVTPALPETGTTAPAATASVGDAVSVAPAEAEKLAEVQKKLSEAEAARAEQEATIAELQNRLAEAESKAAAKPAAPSTPPAEATVPKPAVAKPKPAKPVAPKAVTSWELRSASDGQAWITRRGDNQLFRVTVGDEIPGVGRVTSIGEQGGRWVIVGTEGQIRQ